MRYPLVCISTALHRRILPVVTANSYGILWLLAKLLMLRYG